MILDANEVQPMSEVDASLATNPVCDEGPGTIPDRLTPVGAATGDFSERNDSRTQACTFLTPSSSSTCPEKRPASATRGSAIRDQPDPTFQTRRSFLTGGYRNSLQGGQSNLRGYPRRDSVSVGRRPLSAPRTQPNSCFSGFLGDTESEVTGSSRRLRFLTTCTPTPSPNRETQTVSSSSVPAEAGPVQGQPPTGDSNTATEEVSSSDEGRRTTFRGRWA